MREKEDRSESKAVVAEHELVPNDVGEKGEIRVRVVRECGR